MKQYIEKNAEHQYRGVLDFEDGLVVETNWFETKDEATNSLREKQAQISGADLNDLDFRPYKVFTKQQENDEWKSWIMDPTDAAIVQGGTLPDQNASLENLIEIVERITKVDLSPGNVQVLDKDGNPYVEPEPEVTQIEVNEVNNQEQNNE